MDFDWWSVNIDRSHQFDYKYDPLSIVPPTEPKTADPAPAPAPALVGGFAQALSRMAAANKWSFCAPIAQGCQGAKWFY